MTSSMIFHCKSCNKKYERELSMAMHYYTISHKENGADLDKLQVAMTCIKCGEKEVYTARDIYNGIMEYKESKSTKSFIKEY